MGSITRAVIERAIDTANGHRNIWDDSDKIRLREGYSGRGMHGATCFGVVAPSASDITPFILAVTEALCEEAERESDEWRDGFEVAQDLFADSATDDMGRGIILYFPRWDLEDGE